MVDEQIFQIRDLVNEIPNNEVSKGCVLGYVEDLKKDKKYDISMDNSEEASDPNFKKQLEEQTVLFKKEKTDNFLMDDGKTEKQIPVLHELENFKKSPIVKNKHGKALMNGTQPMVAMFMAIYAQECFPTFRETMRTHFESGDDTRTWSLN